MGTLVEVYCIRSVGTILGVFTLHLAFYEIVFQAQKIIKLYEHALQHNIV
jgi:hypothetical protein